MSAAVPPSSLRQALRRHEIGDLSPYRLRFAGKGTSGGSFGCLQGDLANGPAVVRRTLRAVLATTGLPSRRLDAIAARLARPAARNPLDRADAALVDAALDAPEGRRLVDAMDTALMTGLVRELDRCRDAAAASGRRLTAEAEIMLALWINMSGPPTKLLRWLGGEGVTLARTVPPPGPAVDAAAIERYLAATSYFMANPRNLAHLLRCAMTAIPEPAE